MRVCVVCVVCVCGVHVSEERVNQSACSYMAKCVWKMSVVFCRCLGPQSLMDVCVCGFFFFLEDEYLNNILNDLPTPWTRSLELV